MATSAKLDQHFEKLSDLMVRNGWGLKQALTEATLAASNEEIDRIAKNKHFQLALDTARLRFHSEVAANPDRTKSALLGELQVLAWKLSKDGEYSEAAEILFKIAKIEGWVGAESNVNVFAGLSHFELEGELERLEKREKPAVLA